MPDQSDVDEAHKIALADLPAAAESQNAGAAVMPMDASAIEAFGQRARLAEDRLAEVLAAYRQIKSDQEGQRERTTRTLERRFEQRHERLLVKFIDILDCFDRALEAAETTYAGAPLIEGIILVRTQLLQTLRDEGLERIPVLGLPFDPHVSEAMSTAPVDDPDQHHVVVKELQRGYRFKERLVRPARVVVGEYAQAGVSQAARESDVAPQAAPSQPAPDPRPASQVDTVRIHAYDLAEALRPVPDVITPHPSDEATGQAPLAVTPLTEEEEEDGTPTLEEIVNRVEAGQASRDKAFEETQEAPEGDRPPETE